MCDREICQQKTKKKDINKKSKVFACHLLCPYYQRLWGKCKESQINAWVIPVFCFEGTVTVRITENIPAI